MKPQSVLLAVGAASACYIRPDPLPSPTARTSPAEDHSEIIAGDLPDSFDWREVAGVVSPIRSQYLPRCVHNFFRLARLCLHIFSIEHAVS